MALASTTMRKVALRNLGAHKLRFFLTVLSVFLGTSFVSGSFMFTNTMEKTFDGLMQQSYASIPAAVTLSSQSETRPMEMLDELRNQPYTGNVNLLQQLNVTIATEDGAALQTGGAPSLVEAYYPPEQAVAETGTITDGTAPEGLGEVLINSAAAKKFDIQVGEQLLLVDRATQHQATVSGIISYPMETGASVIVAQDEASFIQLWTNNKIRQGVAVAPAAGTETAQLLADLQRDYPTTEVITGEAYAKKLSEQFGTSFAFMNYFLIAFALMALLVGSFIIANTFAMVVAQRLKEFALLRALGTAQGQITRSVILEALVIGFLGSLLGVLGGWLMVLGIYGLLDRMGFGFPSSGVSLTLNAVLVPLALGMTVTLLSALAPARRAGKVKPVEAMRSGDQSSNISLTLRTIIGAILVLGGIATAGYAALYTEGTPTSQRMMIVGAGVFALILGTYVVSPGLSQPIVPTIGRVIGWPFGAMGKLAATNSRRNPRRTATTAFALTLGVALVTSFGMLGATLKDMVEEATSSTLKTDLIVAAGGGMMGGQPFNPAIADAVAGVPEVARTFVVGFTPVIVGGITEASANAPGSDTSVDPQGDTGAGPGAPESMATQGMSLYYAGDVVETASVNMLEGHADPAVPGVIASADFAAKQGWAVGQELPLLFAGQDTGVRVPLTGVYESGMVLGDQLLNDSARQLVADTLNTDAARERLMIMVMASAADGVDVETARAAVVEQVKPFIVAQVMTPEEYGNSASAALDQMLSVLYALLALSIVVAVLGIINTLALNVVERRQEIGMLRAVGTHRAQIRRLITLESVQIAMYGAVVGVAIGLMIGWAFIRSLSAVGLSNPAYPWTTILAMLVGSAVVGVVSAVWPARRAAKTPPLEAIAEG